MSKTFGVIVLLLNGLYAIAQNSEIRTIYHNENNDSIVLYDNYSEFRFGNVIGGGFVEYNNKKRKDFQLFNDINYTSNTQSTYELLYDHLYGADTISFTVKDDAGNNIDSRDFIIYTIGSDQGVKWANYNKFNRSYILVLKEMPKDNLLFINTNGYDPLKIKINSLKPVSYSIKLKKNKGSTTYLKNSNALIKCKKVNDSTLACKLKLVEESKDKDKVVLFKAN